MAMGSTRTSVGLVLFLVITGTNSIVRQPDCFLKDHDTTYEGKYSKTISGKACQRWDAQTPHAHSYKAGQFPDPTLTLAADHCRVLDGERFPWCLTTVALPDRERCNVPYCTVGAECMVTSQGGEYMGTLNKTKSGKTCQRWDSQTPNAHPYTLAGGANFAEDTLAEVNNYCRNYKGFDPKPWCYTTDPAVTWEYCDPPMCTYKGICGAFPTITNGKSTRTPSATNKYDHEEIVNYVCDTGYDFPDQYDGIYCLLSGKWTAAPSCNPVKCPDPTVPNASFNTTNPANEYKTEVTYACDYGYQLMSGDAKRVCQADRTWTGVEPNCTRIDCGVPPTTSDGSLVSTSTSYIDGIAEYTCTRSSETFFMVCKDDWQWHGTVCGALPTTTPCPTAAPCVCPTCPPQAGNDPSGGGGQCPTQAPCSCPDSEATTAHACSCDAASVLTSTPFIAGAAVAGVAAAALVTGLSIALCRLKKPGIPTSKVSPKL